MAGVTDRALAGLGEGLASQAGPLLAPLVAALAAPVEAADDLLAAPTDAAPVLAVPAVLDLDRTPFPEWLAQLAGITVPTGMAREDVRTLVRTRGISRRGTPAAIIAAAQTALTGTRRVVLLERQGSPWHFTVVTYQAQTPDPAAVVRAVATEKPMGLTFDHVVRHGITWGQLAQTGLTWRQAQQYTWDELGLLVPAQ